MVSVASGNFLGVQPDSMHKIRNGVKSRQTRDEPAESSPSENQAQLVREHLNQLLPFQQSRLAKSQSNHNRISYVQPHDHKKQSRRDRKHHHRGSSSSSDDEMARDARRRHREDTKEVRSGRASVSRDHNSRSRHRERSHAASMPSGSRNEERRSRSRRSRSSSPSSEEQRRRRKDRDQRRQESHHSSRKSGKHYQQSSAKNQHGDTRQGHHGDKRSKSPQTSNLAAAEPQMPVARVAVENLNEEVQKRVRLAKVKFLAQKQLELDEVEQRQKEDEQAAKIERERQIEVDAEAAKELKLQKKQAVIDKAEMVSSDQAHSRPILGCSGKFVEFDEPSAPNTSIRSGQQSNTRRSKFSDHIPHQTSDHESYRSRAGDRDRDRDRDYSRGGTSSDYSRSRHRSDRQIVGQLAPSQHFFRPKNDQQVTVSGGSIDSVFKRKGAPFESPEQFKKNSLTSFELIKQKFSMGKNFIAKTTSSVSVSEDFKEQQQSGNLQQNSPLDVTFIRNDDPLDSFMDQIQNDAIQQETFDENALMQQDQDFSQSASNGMFSFTFGGAAPAQNENAMQDAEEVVSDADNDDAEAEEGAAQQTITLDEIMGLETGEAAAGDTKDEDEDEERNYYQVFVDEIRRKDQLEQITKETNQVNFDEDDDKFIIGLQDGEKSAVTALGGTFLDKEKRRADKKSLKFIDYSQHQYEPIRKNLYIESKELSKMTDREIIEIRKAKGDIKVRGVQCPRPIYSWYHCGLPQTVLSILERKGFKDPFPIQCQSIPAAMSGRDLIGIAETGSGKTLAYVLPMIRHIRDQRPLQEDEGMIALIMAPTRELVLQIFKETKSIAKACGLTTIAVYGGVSVAGQLSELKRGAEIVVCTPGRMRDVLAASNGKITNLKRTSYVVLDEADRMLDMGFEPQIKVMIQNCRPDRQTVMFSATFPRSIETLAKTILRSPVEIVVGNRGQTCSTVEQTIEVLENEEEKLYKLIMIIQEWYDKGSILIFVEKQVQVDELFKELWNVGFKSLVLHGGMDQTDREFTIQDFKLRVRNILIATSVCARGLDIKHIALVINFVCPNHLEDYVHRVGRTGRAGSKGNAITFITPDECASAADLIKALENSANAIIPDELRELDELYQERLRDGDIEKRRSNVGYQGKGHKFSREEEEKVRVERLQLSKGFGYGLGDDAEENEEQEEALARMQQKRLEDQLKQEQYEMIKTLETDPAAKKVAMEAAHKAGKEAIKQGLSQLEANKVAHEAIVMALQEYKPKVVGQDKALLNALKIRDQFVEKENEKSGIFTEEIEINEYPQMVRGKVQSKDFLMSVGEMTNSRIVVKGTYFEAGKKPPPGHKRLHLYMESSSKHELMSAAKEIRRNLEDLAVQATRGGGGLGGGAGAYGEFSGQFTKI